MPVRSGIGIAAPAGAHDGLRALLRRLRRAAGRIRRVRLGWVTCRHGYLESLARTGQAQPLPAADGEGLALLSVDAGTAERLLAGQSEDSDGRVLGAWTVQGRIGQWVGVCRETELAHVADLESHWIAGRAQALPCAGTLRHGLRLEVRNLGSDGDAGRWEVTLDARRLLRLDRVETEAGALEIPELASMRLTREVALPGGRALVVPQLHNPFPPGEPAESRRRPGPERDLLVVVCPQGGRDLDAADPGPSDNTITLPETGGAEGADATELYDIADLLECVGQFAGPDLSLAAADEGARGANPASAERAAPRPTVDDLLAAFRQLTAGRRLFGELRAQDQALVTRGTAAGHRVLAHFLRGVRRQARLMVTLDSRLCRAGRPLPADAARRLAGDGAAPRLELAEAQALLESLGERISVLSAPRIVTFVGQRAHIFVGEQGKYVAGYRVRSAPAGTTLEPDLRTWNAGTVIGLRAVPSPDRRQVVVDLDLACTAHVEDREYRFEVVLDGEKRERLPLQLPRLAHSRITSTCVVADGAACALTGDLDDGVGKRASSAEPDVILLSPRLTDAGGPGDGEGRREK